MIDFFKNKLKILLILTFFVIDGYILYRNFFLIPRSKKEDSVSVKRGDLKQELTISGTVDAEEKVTLRFKTSGRLSWVGVKEGDYVKKYQAIASLDQRELKKTLQKELNDYMNERWDFDQSQED